MASEIELGGRPFNDSPSRRPPHLQRNVTTAPAGSTNGKDRSPDRTTIGRCPPATFTTSKTFDPSSAFRKATLGGSGARWSPDGRVIYYRSATHLMAAALSTRGQVDVVRREQLFADIYSNEGDGQTFDVFPNGREFLFLKGVSAAPPKLSLLVNWQRLLNAAGGKGVVP